MKYVNTKDDSLGGMLHDDGKLTLANKIDGLNVVEIIEDLDKARELLELGVPVVDKMLRILINFFSSICEPFPEGIKQGDKVFRLTMQKARWGAIDRIFYQEEETKEVIMYHEHKTMGGARRELRKELKDYGYIK